MWPPPVSIEACAWVSLSRRRCEPILIKLRDGAVVADFKAAQKERTARQVEDQDAV